MGKRTRSVVLASGIAIALLGTAVAPAEAAASKLTQQMYALGAHQDGDTVLAALNAGQTPESLGLNASQGPRTSTLEDFERAVLAHPAQATADPDSPIGIGECIAKGPAETLYVQDRYNVCVWSEFAVIQLIDGKPTGEAVFTAELIGSAGYGSELSSRFLRFSESISDVRFGGAFNMQAELWANGDQSCFLLSGSNPCQVDERAVQKDTFFNWKLNTVNGPKTWYFDVYVVAGGGRGRRDDVSKAEFTGYFTAFAPPGYTPPVAVVAFRNRLNMRWDNASYLNQGMFRDGAAIFDYIQPLVYHLTGQGIDEVAAHVQRALQTPGATFPYDPNKTIPGGDPQHPLHRLYEHYSLVSPDFSRS